ncbi:ribonuclease H-like protein [Artomyces pyxidatus]|uniref:Ribonuclease H-like protein n=1 Tax=Artomyces pyxidatus TaxID=48021 RepID=A0ACB8TFJ3_9AGAM|nr:ribonuclease H-like protein [Artomyces pyxidatus]
MPKASKPAFYAVKKGRVPGIYRTWDECEDQVKGFNAAVYKKFHDRQSAEEWIVIGRVPSAIPVSSERVVVPSATSSESPNPIPSTSTTTSTTTPTAAAAASTDSEKIVVYTDGSCRGNGQVGAYAGVGVWWGRDDPRNISERCPGAQTNNRAELIAIINALEKTPISDRTLVIKTDSKYCIQCVEDWLPNWRKRAFRSAKGTPVKNIDLVQYFDTLLVHRERQGQKVKLVHVYGHQGEEGNEGADRLANEGGIRQEVPDVDWNARRVELEQQAEAEALQSLDNASVARSATVASTSQALFPAASHRHAQMPTSVQPSAQSGASSVAVGPVVQAQAASLPQAAATASTSAVGKRPKSSKPVVRVLQLEDVDMADYPADLLLSEEEMKAMYEKGEFD